MKIPVSTVYLAIQLYLAISGLAVTGTYSDNSTQVETITSANITGFDSSAPATGQVLTITFKGFTATYTINIIAQTNTATQLKITSSAQTISAGVPSGVFNVQAQNSTGQSTNVSAITHIILSSDSPTGQFSNANSTSCTGSFSNAPFTLTMSTGTANKHFCYQDSASGTYAISVSATGLSCDSQTVIVSP